MMNTILNKQEAKPLWRKYMNMTSPMTFSKRRSRQFVSDFGLIQTGENLAFYNALQKGIS